METGTAIISIASLAALLALTWKFIDFLRLLVNLPGSRSGVITQLASWAAAIGAVFLYGASQVGGRVVVDDLSVDRMDSPTKVLLGLAIGSAASAVVDWKKATDNSDTAVIPPLVPFPPEGEGTDAG